MMTSPMLVGKRSQCDAKLAEEATTADVNRTKARGAVAAFTVTLLTLE